MAFAIQQVGLQGKLQRKLKRSSHPLKDDLSLCIVALLDDDVLQESSEWVEAADRGGLTRVNNITFDLFWMMEKSLREIMSTSPVLRVTEGCVERIKSDDNIQFIWCLMSSDGLMHF